MWMVEIVSGRRSKRFMVVVVVVTVAVIVVGTTYL
jgi:hypothetical protein